jgi:hypothetical protein
LCNAPDNLTKSRIFTKCQKFVPSAGDARSNRRNDPQAGRDNIRKGDANRRIPREGRAAGAPSIPPPGLKSRPSPSRRCPAGMLTRAARRGVDMVVRGVRSAGLPCCAPRHGLQQFGTGTARRGFNRGKPARSCEDGFPRSPWPGRGQRLKGGGRESLAPVLVPIVGNLVQRHAARHGGRQRF